MPALLVTSIAEKTGIPIAEAESRWEAAKLTANSEYDLNPSDGDDYWSYVAGAFKTAMGIGDDGSVLESTDEPKPPVDDSPSLIQKAETFDDIDMAFKRAFPEIEKYQAEQAAFERQLDDYLSGTLKAGAPVILGETPSILLGLGAKALPVIIEQKTLKKVLYDKHGIAPDVIKQILGQIRSPIMVFDSASQKDSLVVVTELEHKEKPIVVAIHLFKEVGHIKVNGIASVYGKDKNEWFGRQIDAGRLRYINKGKSREWFVTRGLQLPKVRGTKNGFDLNILPEPDDVNKILESIVQPNQKPTVSQDQSRKAMKFTLDTQKNTMQGASRPDIGWIAFLWGNTGTGPLFADGDGLARIIAKQDFEKKYLPGEQSGRDKCMRLVDIVTRGYIKRKYGPTSRPKIDFSWQGEVATVSWEPARKTWYLSAWREDWGGILESATADIAPPFDIDALRVVVSIDNNQAPDIPKDWIVFNAPRPMYGDKDWEGDPGHGRFYGAVDPNGERPEWMVKENKSLDGWIYQDIDTATMTAMVRQNYIDGYFKGDAVKVDAAMAKIGTDQIRGQFFNVLEKLNYGTFKALLAIATQPAQAEQKSPDAPILDVDSLRVAVSIGIDQAKDNGVPPGWIVFNTTRPLVGDIVWEGDFTNGRHYAAVDPNGDRAAWMVSKNKGLDGWIYQVVDSDTLKAVVRQEYIDSSQEGDTPIDEAMSYLDETGYKYEFGRILEGMTFGQFKAILAKATAPKREDPRYGDKNGPGDHLGDILAGRVGPDWPEGFTNKVTLTGPEAEAATAEIMNNEAMSYEERHTELKRITSAGMITGSDYGTALWKLIDKEKAEKQPWEMTKDEIIKSSLRLSYDEFGDQAVSRLNHQRTSSGKPVMKETDESSLRVQATIASRERFTAPIVAAQTFQDITAVFGDVFGVTLDDSPVMESAIYDNDSKIFESILEGSPDMTTAQPDSAGKQPWEMTRSEYRFQENSKKLKAIVEAIKQGKTVAVYTHLRVTHLTSPDHVRLASNGEMQTRQSSKWITLVNPQVDRLAEQAGFPIVEPSERVFHSDLIGQALSEGKPVPAEVIKDYRNTPGIAWRFDIKDAKTFQDIAAVFDNEFGVYLDDEPVMESAQIRTPVTVEENIQRGTEAMKRVISKHVNEPRAMYRQELGWIAFYWGKPGGGPPLFRGGSGISHIIAKRDWEGEHVKELIGQKGADVAIKLVSVIATSKDISVLSGKRLVIKKDGFIVYLSKDRHGEEDIWLLTGFKETSTYTITESSVDPGADPDASRATHDEPTLYVSHHGSGAFNQNIDIPDGNVNKIFEGIEDDLVNDTSRKAPVVVAQSNIDTMFDYTLLGDIADTYKEEIAIDVNRLIPSSVQGDNGIFLSVIGTLQSLVERFLIKAGLDKGAARQTRDRFLAPVTNSLFRDVKDKLTSRPSDDIKIKVSTEWKDKIQSASTFDDIYLAFKDASLLNWRMPRKPEDARKVFDTIDWLSPMMDKFIAASAVNRLEIYDVIRAKMKEVGDLIAGTVRHMAPPGYDEMPGFDQLRKEAGKEIFENSKAKGAAIVEAWRAGPEYAQNRQEVEARENAILEVKRQQVEAAGQYYVTEKEIQIRTGYKQANADAISALDAASLLLVSPPIR